MDPYIKLLSVNSRQVSTFPRVYKVLLPSQVKQCTLVRSLQYSVDSTESDATELQPSNCQRNPAYIHFDPSDNSPAASLSDSCSENPGYNINAQPSVPQEPTYEVIPSDTHRTTQGAQTVNCSQNPVYIHLPVGVHVEETLQSAAAATSPCDYSQNPAYGIHSNPN
jgi:hypothetical protein